MRVTHRSGVLSTPLRAVCVRVRGDVTEGNLGTTTYALRFIAGKYKGGEFPLRPNREIVVGRGSEFDMVLDEDMVSRRHAKIATYHGQIVVQDMKSTNGTFVNGDRVTVQRLKVGDKVLVGTSIMELVRLGSSPSEPLPDPNEVAAAVAAAATSARPTVAGALGPRPEAMTAPRPTIDQPDGMMGRWPEDDIVLSDVLELFCGSGRTGLLGLKNEAGHQGRVFFRNGQIYYATIKEPERSSEVLEIDPAKAFWRLMAWPSGAFKMKNKRVDTTIENEITMDTRELLLEGARQQDELARYAEHLPDRLAKLTLCQPIEPALSALSAEALDTLQLVINYHQLASVLDYSAANDLETCQDLLYLLQNGYIEEG